MTPRQFKCTRGGPVRPGWTCTRLTLTPKAHPHNHGPAAFGQPHIVMSGAARGNQAPGRPSPSSQSGARRRSLDRLEQCVVSSAKSAVPETMLVEKYAGKAAFVEAAAAASCSTLPQRPRSAGYVAVAAAPRVIWGTSLVLMLTFIFLCQGGFLFGRADSEKVLSIHYICMSIAWPVRQLAASGYVSTGVVCVDHMQ